MDKSKVSIRENTATVEEVTAMAKEIWKEIKTKEQRTEAECKSLVADLYKRYPDFCRTFPVMVEFTVCSNKFNQKVFMDYLKYYNIKTKGTENRSEEDFLKIQAEFLVFDYKQSNPHAQENQIRKFRQYHIEQIKAAAKENKEQMERLTKAAELEDAEEIKRLRKKLIEKLSLSRPNADSELMQPASKQIEQIEEINITKTNNGTD